MSVKINNIRIAIENHGRQNEDINMLREAAAQKLQIHESKIQNLRIVRESIDARRKGKVDFVYSVMVDLYDREDKLVNRLQNSDVRYIPPKVETSVQPGTEKLTERPIIVGTGPAGLFAGLVLASEGYRPLVLERGEDVDNRTRKVHRFWETNQLDTETNVQFGEGGAGTFSDGKLTTRINDGRCEKVLQEFVKAGAPDEILYKGKPHIGTDLLKDVVKNMRARIIALGGEVQFNTKVTDLNLSNGKVCSVKVNGKEEIPCSVVILAVGHSARDTYEMLLKRGVEIVQKAFSIGVRIEHPQRTIDIAQYGNYAGHPRLKAADYQLVYKSKDRTCYSFCMCPGGIVVAAASEYNSIVTNGMSEFARDRDNANSALVVSVGPEDFKSNHPLAGVTFQRKWERLAFEVGGSNYSAPIQRVGDFLDGRATASLRSNRIQPSYTGNVTPADLAKCLPEYVVSTMKDGLRYFHKKIKEYAAPDVLITGVETRTSAPVRIPRTESGEAVNIQGLYPAGEGAGYAGGIVSAAVDGIKMAEAIIRKYAPPR